MKKAYQIKNSKHKKARVVTVILDKMSSRQKTTTRNGGNFYNDKIIKSFKRHNNN